MVTPPESLAASEYRVYSLEGRSQTGFAGRRLFPVETAPFHHPPGLLSGAELSALSSL